MVLFLTGLDSVAEVAREMRSPCMGAPPSASIAKRVAESRSPDRGPRGALSRGVGLGALPDALLISGAGYLSVARTVSHFAPHARRAELALAHVRQLRLRRCRFGRERPLAAVLERLAHRCGSPGHPP